MPVLFEDRAALAIDKPAYWMLIPFTWQRTNRNLQAALTSSIAAGHFWARARNLRFLRYVHRLDAETTGVLLFGKNKGAVQTLGRLFEMGRISKRYLAVVHGRPKAASWECTVGLSEVAGAPGRMCLDARGGKPSATRFNLLDTRGGLTLIEASPLTGRTHQIRLHLRHAELPIVGDALYGRPDADGRPAFHQDRYPMGLRAVGLAYRCPFTSRPVCIRASSDDFLRAFGFDAAPRNSSNGGTDRQRGLQLGAGQSEDQA